MPQSSMIGAPSRTRNTRSTWKLEEKWGLNSRNPVSRLPPEVLLLIFDLIRLAYHETKEKLARAQLLVGFDDGVEEKIQDYKDFIRIGWIGVSHVCRRWRAAALGSTNLWSKIEVEDARCRWAMEMLKRSKESLLAIELDLYLMDRRSRDKHTPTAVARSALTIVQKKLARCKQLTLSPHPDGCVTIESVLAGHPMPELSSLTIRSQRTVHIPDTLSDKSLDTGSLRTLKLSNVNLDWNASFLQGFTSLQLHRYREKMPFLRFLDYMAMIPLLKRLDIHLISFTLEKTDFELVQTNSLNLRPLQLTHLSVFSTDSPLQTIILLHFVAKNSVCLSISVADMLFEGEEDLKPLFSAISGHIQSAKMYGGLIRRCVVVYCPESGTLSLRGHYNGFQHPMVPDISDPVALNLKIILKDENPPANHFLIHSLYCQLPVRQLVGFSFMCEAPFPSLDWLSTFGGIPTLQYLYVDGRWASHVFEGLCRDTFPVLRDSCCMNADTLFHDFESGVFLRSLRTRNKSGSPIRVLELSKVNSMSATNKQTLRSLVGCLILC